METKQQIIIMYLDWVNNFLSLSAFAYYYGIDQYEAEIIIEAGEKLNEH